MDYNITLSQTENKALSYAALDQNDWIQHVVHDRCRIAIEEIVQQCVAKCLETGTAIPGTKEELVDLAFANGWVKTAAELKAQADAELAARIAEYEAAQQEG